MVLYLLILVIPEMASSLFGSIATQFYQKLPGANSTSFVHPGESPSRRYFSGKIGHGFDEFPYWHHDDSQELPVLVLSHMDPYGGNSIVMGVLQ